MFDSYYLAYQRLQIFTIFTLKFVGVFNILFLNLHITWQYNVAQKPRKTWFLAFLQVCNLPVNKPLKNPQNNCFFTFYGINSNEFKTIINMKKTILSIALVAILSSCQVTRTSIGNFPPGKPDKETVQVYSQVKQRYLFKSTLPLGIQQVEIPKEDGYQIKTSIRFIDWFFTALTFGTYSQQTIEVLVKKK